MKKYKFVERFRDAQITIPILRKTVTEQNATDKDIEFLLEKFPGKFDHNFELVAEAPSKPKAEPKQEPKEEAKSFPQDEPNEEWTVEQLREFAEYNGINLGRAKKEAAILKKIRQHEG